MNCFYFFHSEQHRHSQRSNQHINGVAEQTPLLLFYVSVHACLSDTFPFAFQSAAFYRPKGHVLHTDMRHFAKRWFSERFQAKPPRHYKRHFHRALIVFPSLHTSICPFRQLDASERRKQATSATSSGR